MKILSQNLYSPFGLVIHNEEQSTRLAPSHRNMSVVDLTRLSAIILGLVAVNDAYTFFPNLIELNKKEKKERHFMPMKVLTRNLAK